MVLTAGKDPAFSLITLQCAHWGTFTVRGEGFGRPTNGRPYGESRDPIRIVILRRGTRRRISTARDRYIAVAKGNESCAGGEILRLRLRLRSG